MTTDERTMFPAWFDRLQARYMNPVVRPLAPYLPGFAVIEHRGRKSGRPYSTPVNAFRFDGKLCVVMGHGRTDWIRNVLAAGEADVVRASRRHKLVNPRIVARGEAGPDLPLPARLAARRLPLFMADIQPA
ncbi:nitroreductase family deazaflavin-dependent oxidoreductase [Nocardia aurantiaca]|uniref:Nitroreductase family deazaflavin-dependent oxidoreductase n=1 Tax=Nocardia aurantiaca TaxID=2675850 RepID=A0A6I3L050_9NOCA|nr:nitroreductase family deazaflavin-dependent oxidoreductase [Nocardia aurantiaca]MTE13219.1 nitroreductase family deazaflavin-dependent oxidoreductase [Nocardia aurantiaca]